MSKMVRTPSPAVVRMAEIGAAAFLSAPRLFQLAKPLARRLYRAVVYGYSVWVSWRYGWEFPKGVPEQFRIGFVLGTWECATRNILERELFDGAVFVDIGANVGYYTRLAAEITGLTGKVFAFEPEPQNFFSMMHNVRRYNNVSVFPVALWSESGLRRLYVSTYSGCHSLVRGNDGSLGDGYVWVPTITFDQFVGTVGLSKIDLVKIDAEGAEPLILRGMAETLRRGLIKSLVVEYNPRSILRAGLDPVEFGRMLMMVFDVRVIEQEKYGLNVAELNDTQKLEALTSRIVLDNEWGCVNLFCESRTT